MGREKWNKMSEKDRQKLSRKILEKMDELSNIKESYDECLELYEMTIDDAKDIFECNLNCETCTEDDRAKCLQNFRMANVFLLRKDHLFHDLIQHSIEAFLNWCLEFNNILHYQSDSKEESTEEKEEEDDDEDCDESLNERKFRELNRKVNNKEPKTKDSFFGMYS